MDAFGAVRAHARRKQAELMDSLPSGTPVSAAHLLAAAAADTGLKILFVPRDYPLLAQGDGALMRETGNILVAQDLDDDMRAFVQAHEFAHFWIESPADPVLVSHGIDPGAPEVASPLGIRRVEGYSSQELRERYANVFAREFLLPYPLARERFLDGGDSASKLAKDLGIPQRLVHQQLAGALLLPEIDDHEAPPKPVPELDPSQRIAATHAGGPALIEAGPGTGKTRTLIGRIEHLLREGAPPISILVLTYSNKAANEIKERVARSLPQAAEIWAGTFHAFGLELLRKYADRLGLALPVHVVDLADALIRIERILPELELDHYLMLHDPLFYLPAVLSAISRAKDEICSPAQYRALAEHMAQVAVSEEERTSAAKALEVAGVYARYETMLRDAGVVDFGDLIQRAVELLQQHPDVLAELREQYRHFLVDEYQDVNRASGALLKLIAGGGDGLWVVGDVRQAIYRFRGASPANTRDFEVDFPGAARWPLEVNYRSRKEIADTFGRFARSIDDPLWRHTADLQASRGSGGARVLTIAPDLDAEAAALAATIERQREQGYTYRDQAILPRTHLIAERLCARLEARGVPVLYLGDVFEREEVRHLLAVLSFLAEPHRGALLRLATLPAYAMNLADVRAFLGAARAAERTPYQALSTEAMATVSDTGRVALSRLRADLISFNYRTPAAEVLFHGLFETRSLLTPLLQGDDAASQQRRLATFQFLQFAVERHDGGEGDPKKHLLQWVRRLEQLGEERALREPPTAVESIDAVRVMTVHASKGLEFPVVYLPSLAKGKFPPTRQWRPCPAPVGMIRPGDDDADREEASLFYVALSRAQDQLWISRAERYGSQNAKASPFLDALTGVLSPKTAPPVSTAPIVSDAPRPDLARTIDSHDARDLDKYRRCPRQYAYQLCMELPGGRDDDAYLRFHRSVYRVIDWAIEQRGQGEVSTERLMKELDRHWITLGPHDHPMGPIYRRFADRLLDAVAVHLRRGSDGKTTASVTVAGKRIDVIVDASEAAGGGVVRRYKTGRPPKKIPNDLPEYLMQLAAQALHGPQACSELHYLSTDTTAQPSFSANVMANRASETAQIISGIEQGLYPTTTDVNQCPRCAFYFCCPSLPLATLS